MKKFTLIIGICFLLFSCNRNVSQEIKNELVENKTATGKQINLTEKKDLTNIYTVDITGPEKFGKKIIYYKNFVTYCYRNCYNYAKKNTEFYFKNEKTGFDIVSKTEPEFINDGKSYYKYGQSCIGPENKDCYEIDKLFINKNEFILEEIRN